eukprot:SAG25_NODE_1113_length_3925_cov_8.766858_4_plen_31_part_01
MPPQYCIDSELQGLLSPPLSEHALALFDSMH